MNKYSKIWRALRRGSPTILSGLAVIGVIATGYFSAKGGMKAKQIIDENKWQLKDTEKKEKLKWMAANTWSCYIPAVVCGVASTACIIFSNRINKRQIAALSATAALISERYLTYQKQVDTAVSTLPKESRDDFYAELQAQQKLGPSNYVLELPDDIDTNKLPLFYESMSGTFFRSTIEKVQSAEYHLNRNISLRGYAPFNEWLDFLGLNDRDCRRYDDSYAWDLDYLAEVWESYWLDFDHHTFVTDTGETATAINVSVDPHYSDWL